MNLVVPCHHLRRLTLYLPYCREARQLTHTDFDLPYRWVGFVANSWAELSSNDELVIVHEYKRGYTGDIKSFNQKKWGWTSPLPDLEHPAPRNLAKIFDENRKVPHRTAATPLDESHKFHLRCMNFVLRPAGPVKRPVTMAHLPHDYIPTEEDHEVCKLTRDFARVKTVWKIEDVELPPNKLKERRSRGLPTFRYMHSLSCCHLSPANGDYGGLVNEFRNHHVALKPHFCVPK